MPELKRGNELEIKIEGLAYGGRGIARHQEKIIFVPDVFPGDVVRVRIHCNRANYMGATVIDLIQPSALRITPRCPLQGKCGGCSWQALPYEKQLIFKEAILHSTLGDLERQMGLKPLSIIPSPLVWHYRNKMEFTFGKDDSGELVLGLHCAGSYAKVVDIKQCYLHPPEFDIVLEIVRQFVRERHLEPYDPIFHKGLLRHLVLRYSQTTGKLLGVLLTSRGEPKELKMLARAIRGQVPSFSGFIWGINTKIADVAQAEKIIYVDGDDYLIEELDGLKFSISAFSFFQPNTRAAEQLYRIVKEFAELSEKEVLLDAYCGTGTIGIFCANRALFVYGIELLPEVVWDARRNAAINSLENCLFLSGDIPRTLSLLQPLLLQPINRIVIDPPRAGMDKKSIRALINLGAPLIVYVSCNPATLMRDLEFFTEAGYELKKFQPVDLFPHTFHIENVVQLVKK